MRLSADPAERLRSRHIGLNLVFLVPGETGGMEVYARELIEAMVAVAPGLRITAFVNREAAEARWTDTVPTVTVPVRARRRAEWVRGEQALLPGLAARAGVDLLHSLASTAPARGRFRRVATIHDLHYRTIPEAHLGLVGLGMRVLVPLAARRSQLVITGSETSRSELVSLLGVAAEKIQVIPHGVGAQPRVEALPEGELRGRLGLGDRPVVLSVSAKRPHKNLPRLIEALAAVPAPERPVLVVPGYPTSHEDELRAQAARLGVSEDLRLLGWVDAEELEGLYEAAVCVVYPTLAEGFGLPVLEAMRRGVPVACSGTGAVREVAAGGALLFDPLRTDAITAAMQTLLADRSERERLRAAGLARAAQFTWERSARGHLAAYERVLSGPVTQ